MRAFAEAWPDADFVQEALAQLPWYHQLALLDKLKTADARRWYTQKAIDNNWSRNVLVMYIETRLLEWPGQAVTNFEQRLPKPQSDLTHESIIDPYRVDFLGLTDEAYEHEIGLALIRRVTWLFWNVAWGSPLSGDSYCLMSAGKSLLSILPLIISKCVAMWWEILFHEMVIRYLSLL